MYFCSVASRYSVVPNPAPLASLSGSRSHCASPCGELMKAACGRHALRAAEWRARARVQGREGGVGERGW